MVESLFRQLRFSAAHDDRWPTCTKSCWIRASWLPDYDALEEDNGCGDGGHVGHELSNEVFDGRSGQADAIALGVRR